jgi:hypothetical protein
MESRKRPDRRTPPSRVDDLQFDTGAVELKYISMLIDDGGQVTLGAVHPIPCVAIANDNQGSLAMLRRRANESIPQLLRRLNDSIALAMEADEIIDEINVRPPARRP